MKMKRMYLQSTTTTEVVSGPTTEAINKILEAVEVFKQQNKNIEDLKTRAEAHHQIKV
jgi:hypothetical protein